MTLFLSNDYPESEIEAKFAELMKAQKAWGKYLAMVPLSPFSEPVGHNFKEMKEACDNYNRIHAEYDTLCRKVD